MNPLLETGLLDRPLQRQRVLAVPGSLPITDLPVASEVRAVSASGQRYTPMPDRASRSALPMPGSYLSVRDAAAACDRAPSCGGVVSQRNGRTLGLLPLAGGASSGGKSDLVAVPGTTTWLKGG